MNKCLFGFSFDISSPLFYLKVFTANGKKMVKRLFLYAHKYSVNALISREKHRRFDDEYYYFINMCTSDPKSLVFHLTLL